MKALSSSNSLLVALLAASASIAVAAPSKDKPKSGRMLTESFGKPHQSSREKARRLRKLEKAK